jgi:hypothetical protein
MPRPVITSPLKNSVTVWLPPEAAWDERLCSKLILFMSPPAGRVLVMLRATAVLPANFRKSLRVLEFGRSSFIIAVPGNHKN